MCFTRTSAGDDRVPGRFPLHLQAVVDDLPVPTAAAHNFPVTDAGRTDGSYQTFADGPWPTKPAVVWFWFERMDTCYAFASLSSSFRHQVRPRWTRSDDEATGFLVALT
jgi:hypothetical protein